MPAKISQCILFMILFSTVSPATTTQDKSSSQFEKFSARVQVIVDTDGQLGDDIKSYLNRALRSLGDVIITDNKPDYRVKIVALEEQAGDGTKLGYALSVLITMPLDPLGLKFATAIIVGSKNEKDSLNLQKSIEKQVEGYELVLGHAVRSGGSDSLRML